MKWVLPLISITLLTLIKYTDNAVIPSNTDAPPQGLYAPTDDVKILTVKNFKQEVYGKKHAWFVEFYNSWCGFCQRFAPSWKALGTDIKEWNDMVTIGAVDCSDDDNYPLCRGFEIMQYPTLLYFHEHYVEGPKNLGLKVPRLGSDVNEHRHKLIKFIIDEQLVHNRGKQYPNLLSINQSFSDIFNSNSNINYIFVIIEDATAFLAQEVALDLHNVTTISIKYAYLNNTKIVQDLQAAIDSIYVISRQRINDFEQITTASSFTRDAVRDAITNYLKSQHVTVSERTKHPDIFTGKWMEAKVPDMSEFIKKKEEEALLQKIKSMGDAVFQMDLETALRYSLKHEIAGQKEITGEKLQALKKYLNVLVDYFPFGRYGKIFLTDLRNYVSNTARTVIKGTEIGEIVREAERDGRNVFSTPQQWLACKGSLSSTRRYPCGLWKMFHYLTVNIADRERSIKGANPRKSLETMHAYIKNFFGCADCSQHFQEMAAKRELTGVSSFNESILWLWRAHNEVNARLAGDQTEDPAFPKIQFPSTVNCPKCRVHNNDDTNDSWNIPEVLNYLENVYSSIHVKYIGADTKVLHMGLEGDSATSDSTISIGSCFNVIVLVAISRILL